MTGARSIVLPVARTSSAIASANPLLEVHVEGGSARLGDRERGRVDAVGPQADWALRGETDAARTVAKYVPSNSKLVSSGVRKMSM